MSKKTGTIMLLIWLLAGSLITEFSEISTEKHFRRTENEWICTRCRLPAEGSYCVRCGQPYERPSK